MTSYRHSRACVKKFGGIVDDYNPINFFLDSSKLGHGDVRHRALYHHTVGIELCEKLFGKFITNADNIEVPVREIAEFHVHTDLGWIPTPSDWLKNMQLNTWMGGHQKRGTPKFISFEETT